MCEPQRRLEQKNETGVRVGYNAWLRFNELTQGSVKTKSYEDFVYNQFYNGFVKFGRHVTNIRAINPTEFIDYVIGKKIKLDRWCEDRIYTEYLQEQLRRENPNDAMERSIATMLEWSDEVNDEYNHYFINGDPNTICMKIEQGRISPWILYNCDSGLKFLEILNEDQINVIFDRIDPEFWHTKFGNYMADTEYCKKLLKDAGL